VKGYNAKQYTKQHMAKNSIPAPYIHHICRDWLKVHEEANGETDGRPDYSDYDSEMDLRRRTAANQSIYEYMDDTPEPDEARDSPVEDNEATAVDPETEDD